MSITSFHTHETSTKSLLDEVFDRLWDGPANIKRSSLIGIDIISTLLDNLPDEVLEYIPAHVELPDDGDDNTDDASSPRCRYCGWDA